MTSVVGFCLLAALLSKVLERYAREQAVLVTLGACAGVLLLSVLAVAPILAQVTALFERAGLQIAYASLVCKAVGICWLTQLGMDVCRDCREEALATAVSMAGKLTLLLLALPLLESLLSMVGGLLP